MHMHSIHSYFVYFQLFIYWNVLCPFSTREKIDVVFLGENQRKTVADREEISN